MSDRPTDEQLLDLVLGMLEPAAEEALRARCEAEPELAARVAALSAEQDALAEVLRVEPSAPGLEDRLVAGLRAAPALPRERRFRWGRFTALAAGLLIAALLGAQALQRGEPPRQQLLRKTRVSELEALGLGGAK